MSRLSFTSTELFLKAVRIRDDLGIADELNIAPGEMNTAKKRDSAKLNQPCFTAYRRLVHLSMDQ